MPVSDEAFAQAVHQMGAVTLDHIEAARAAQSAAAQRGQLLSLADIMLQQGILTPAMRETIEKRLAAQQQGGLTQLSQYKLVKKLGEGGMGMVFLAEDTMAERKVAVKVLPKKYAADKDFLTLYAQSSGEPCHIEFKDLWLREVGPDGKPLGEK